MSGRVLLTGVGAVVAVLLVLTMGLAGLLGGNAAACGLAATAPDPAPGRSSSTVTVTAAAASEVFDADQKANAQTIIETGVRLLVPVRGQIIAVATAITESGLWALDHGDSAGPDSRGLFQQRAAWGPQTERLDPAGSATLFYTGGRGGQPGLLDVPHWQTLPLTEAAQAVQRSARPNAYAVHEDEATQLVLDARMLAPRKRAGLDQGEAAGCPGEMGTSPRDAGSVTLPTSFTFPAGTPGPVVRAVTWALAQRGTPYHYGGDCLRPRSGQPAHECDCSSLVQIAYRTAGVDLPRTTLEQVHAGVSVPDFDDLRAGDLVFIPGSDGTVASPRHVGIYVGEGLVVHAPRTGEDVRLARVAAWGSISAVRRVVTSQTRKSVPLPARTLTRVAHRAGSPAWPRPLPDRPDRDGLRPLL